MKKRLISLLLAFSMMLTFLPAGAVSAFAEGTADDTTKETLLKGGENITDSGTYQLNGTYKKGITINTTGSVVINVTGNVTGELPHIEWGTVIPLISIQAGTVNFNGDSRYTVTNNQVICNDGGNLTVNGGKYVCKKHPYERDALCFSLGRGRNLIENVTIETDCGAISLGSNGENAVIRSSKITAKWAARDGAIFCRPKDKMAVMELDDVEVEAEEGDALLVETGTVTVNGGNYKSGNKGCAIGTRANSDVDLDLTINGGTYQGNDYTVADFGCHGHPRDPRECNIHIHGSTFVGGRLLRFYGDYAKTLTIDDNTTFQSIGGTRDAVVVGHGQLFFNSGTIEVSGGSQRSALCTYDTGEAIVNGGTFRGAKCDIYEQNDDYRVSPDRVQLKNATFDDNVCNVYLEKDLQIDVAQNYTGEVTIECADPSDGRQLTKATETNYQKDLNLTSANAGYLVGYKKTADGKGEYRCLSKEVGVTISNLKSEIKAEDPAEFTVTLTHEGSTGTGILTFGDKNGEIEYKDEESGEYKPMQKDGLKINLENGEPEHEFRITPKETGKQTLTAAVKKDEKELAKDEKDFVVSEMPILTLKDGVITSVTVPGKNGADPEDITEIVKKNANEDGSFHVPEGATVSVAFDKDAFADSGLKFGHWDITGLDDPNAYQNKESFAFVMPAKAVTLKAMTQDASIEDDEPDIVGPIVIGTTVVVGGAVLGYQAYSLGAEFAGKLMALPYFPSNRSALAMMLWEDAGKPMPESELLYPDVGQEERDMDLQHAARWAMENDLVPDLNDEGTAPEEMKFYPDNTVSKIDVLKAWQKAQELKQNA